MTEWMITTAVGTGEKGFAGDGGPATEAQLNGPFDVAFDGAGNLYFSDTFNHRIRRVEAVTGIISTIAGNGDAGYSGDGGSATQAALNEPYGVVVDRAGNVYTADRLNRRVRRIDAGSGVITTLAGTGVAAWSGDAGPASQAGLAEPNGLAFDPDERRLYIADVADHRVRVVDLASGVIGDLRRHRHGRARRRRRPGARCQDLRRARGQTRAGRHGLYPRTPGQQPARRRSRHRPDQYDRRHAGRGYSGDGGPAVAAVFDAPKEMALDRDGSLLIVDTENHAIRRIDRASGIITTIAGGRQGGHGDGGPAERPGSTGRTAPSWPGWRDLYRRHEQPPHSQSHARGLIVRYRMLRLPLAAACAGIALSTSPAARADPLAAVTVSSDAVLTICRNWILFRSCKHYDKIDLPPRIAVGDRLDLTFGGNPKDYLFHVVEIRRKGEGCMLLSNISKGHEDRERIEVARCEPVGNQAAEPR